ncbi:hypothetical protein C8Q74DRAFT_974013 [Fomes fomentarius]|nr:hypothetical protein C8Q74DRAFT_974013 [Fomes fomentarius]
MSHTVHPRGATARTSVRDTLMICSKTWEDSWPLLIFGRAGAVRTTLLPILTMYLFCTTAPRCGRVGIFPACSVDDRDRRLGRSSLGARGITLLPLSTFLQASTLNLVGRQIVILSVAISPSEARLRRC